MPATGEDMHPNSLAEAEKKREVDLVSVPKLVSEYFKDSGMTLQEYFKFPEMSQIKNPVNRYFNLQGAGEKQANTHWIEEGTLAVEEGEDGWICLGAEHLELARIAVGRSRDPKYFARPWGDSYFGPVLRSTGAVLRTSLSVASTTVGIAGLVLTSVASLVFSSSPRVPPSDADLSDRFVEECVEVDGQTWWFRVWLPPDLEAVRKKHGGLPAFLLLHGFKECGWDNWWQTNCGLALHLQTWSWAGWFPGILVLPQLPRRPWDDALWKHWREEDMQKMALAALDKAVTKYKADRKRLYLLGESLGAEGAWYLAAANPGHFAAVGACAGSVESYNWQTWEWVSEPGVYKSLAEGIGRDTPMWFCHGGLDDFVPLEQSMRLYEALQQARASSTVSSLLGRGAAGEIVFKEYEDVGHHVWDRAYCEDDLIQWLLAQSKP